MTCKKCKSEWKTEQHISASLVVCPFCGESIADEGSGKPIIFDNSQDTLVFIAKQYGNKVLLGKQLRAFFSDYAPQVSRNIKDLVFAVYEKGASSILQSNLNAKQEDKEIALKQAIATLTEAFITQEAAENIIHEFAEALGWQMRTPIQKQQSTAQPPRRQSVSPIQKLQSAAQPQTQPRQSVSSVPSQHQQLVPPTQTKRRQSATSIQSQHQQLVPPTHTQRRQSASSVQPQHQQSVSPVRPQRQQSASSVKPQRQQSASSLQKQSQTQQPQQRSNSVYRADTNLASEIIQGKKQNLQFGGYDWIILNVQGDRALLLTEDIIEKRSFNSEFVVVTWENCTLRQYLNVEFFGNFSRLEQLRITEVSNANQNNRWFGTAGGDSTKDKVFLLSIKETVKYFGDSGQLQKRPAKDSWWINDRYNKERISKYRNVTWWWWLRSPGRNSNDAAFVHNLGSLILSGNGVGNEEGGVRPALWLDLKS